MIDHVWTIVCSRAVIDRDTNNVSIQNVVEQLTIRDKPRPDGAFLIGPEVMMLFVRSDFDMPCQGLARLTFLSPSGETLVSVDSKIDLSEYDWYRKRVGFKRGLPMRGAGRYVFCVELQNEGESEWRQVAVVPLKIVFRPPEPEQETSEI